MKINSKLNTSPAFGARLVTESGAKKILKQQLESCWYSKVSNQSEGFPYELNFRNFKFNKFYKKLKQSVKNATKGIKGTIKITKCDKIHIEERRLLSFEFKNSKGEVHNALKTAKGPVPSIVPVYYIVPQYSRSKQIEPQVMDIMSCLADIEDAYSSGADASKFRKIYNEMLDKKFPKK